MLWFIAKIYIIRGIKNPIVNLTIFINLFLFAKARNKQYGAINGIYCIFDNTDKLRKVPVNKYLFLLER